MILLFVIISFQVYVSEPLRSLLEDGNCLQEDPQRQLNFSGKVKALEPDSAHQQPGIDVVTLIVTRVYYDLWTLLRL